MPCRSDYMEPNEREIYLSRVLAFHDELNGKPGIQHNWYQGYHPHVYCKSISIDEANKWVEYLCSRCRKIDVTKHSLELQMWWRDHQAADARRQLEEKEAAELKVKRQAALAKLTPEDREALGLKEEK